MHELLICLIEQALYFDNCNNLHLSGTRHLNSARNHISIHDSTNTKFFNVTITAPQDSPNTDGIDISQSSYILIQNSIIATGDDCVAINNGTSNINITGVTCGPGHGISVGSLGAKGSYAVVEQVHVYNCTFKGSDNGMRIKTWPGGFGYARKISFEHIILEDTKNPIIIDQNYVDKLDEDNNNNQRSAVQISGVTYRYVKGTSDSKTAIILNCRGKVGCTDIIMDAINITYASSGSATQSSCSDAHGEAFSTSPYVSCLSQ
ncbi:probable polygalacturonase At3g15720 [Lotus japonicus]|uniref:probable polygalacturonase At3g15720 n=1 Tax=Lotus japonicus TaxID=34305 RepID=UPI00258504C3|nr:probable polygalacturonase At3g15720 [Lotus japonicus]